MKHSPNLHTEFPKIKPEEIQGIILSLEQNDIIKYRHKDKVSTAAETYKNTDTCARYIGKTRSEGKSMYDANFLLAVLLNAIYYYQQTGKKAYIIQATGLYDVLKTQEDPYALSVQDQKKCIENMINNHIDKRCSDMIVIQEVSSMHPRLFKTLEDRGIQGIKTTERVYLNDGIVDALTIARYLYRCMKSHEDFKQKMFRLKQGLEKNDALNDYYGMIEIACRLTDMLHGINTQCGEVRQNLYDDRIRLLMHGDMTKYKELKPLQEYLQIKLGENTIKNEKLHFNTIYIDGKEYEKYNHDIVALKDRIKRKIIKNIAKIGLAALLLGGLTYISVQGYNEYKKDKFMDQKQKQITDNLLLTYNTNQIEYFKKQVIQTTITLKTFYGIHDDEYIQGLIRPFLVTHPDIVDYIMKQNGSEGDVSPIATPLPSYIAMMIMKDQEKKNFLEFYGDDALGYKKYDQYIPNMLATLKYYDTIFDINKEYEVKKNQELLITPGSQTVQGVMGLNSNTKYIGEGLVDDGEAKTRIYLVDQHPYNDEGKTKQLLATGNGVGKSDRFKTTSFIDDYLSYRQQTKYLALQTALYIVEEMNKKDSTNKGGEHEEIYYIGDIEHVIKKAVLHGTDLSKYSTKEYKNNPGKEIVENIILKDKKCIEFFKKRMLIDIEKGERLPGYDAHHTIQGGENSAYRNRKEYKEDAKEFYKRE